MATSHKNLVKQAKQILRDKGFPEDAIHEGFLFKDYRIDVVGWSHNRKTAIPCGHCDQKKRQDLQRFFDEVICLSYKPQTNQTLTQSDTSADTLAKMRLVLIKEDNIVFEVPLSRKQWSKEILEDEMAFMEQDFERFSKLFDALSHMNRLRIMKHLIEDDDLTMGFAEFIRDLDLNPKLVWESTRKLRESGLLRKSDNGRYRCSEFGEASFMVSLVLRRLREVFEEY